MLKELIGEMVLHQKLKRKVPSWARNEYSQTMSKAALARSLGISRSTLYYIPLRETRDPLLRDIFLVTLTDHPAYAA